MAIYALLLDCLSIVLLGRFDEWLKGLMLLRFRKLFLNMLLFLVFLWFIYYVKLRSSLWNRWVRKVMLRELSILNTRSVVYACIGGFMLENVYLYVGICLLGCMYYFRHSRISCFLANVGLRWV